MGMMQVAFDKIIDVIAMGNSRVAAIGTMNVGGVVPVTLMPGRAGVWVLLRYGKAMLVVVIVVMVVQVTVVEIVDMAFVQDGGVAASRSVDVDVVTFGVNLMGHKPLSWVLFRKRRGARRPRAVRRRAPER